MTQLQTTAIIRQRRQLTIPDSVAKKVTWANPGSVVTVSASKPNEIVISPHSTSNQVNWDKLWQDLERVRSYKGKWHGSLSKFVVKDRQTRR